jgi:hypothetical protein
LHVDVAFAEFYCYSNFIPDDILSDVVARSENHENCSLYQMDSVRDKITDSLMQ